MEPTSPSRRARVVLPRVPGDELAGDCGACAALCCVATSFERGAAFAFDKPAGVRCHQLTDEDRCAIHAERSARGCAGCVAYDCHGAGQAATARFGDAPAAERDAAFLALARVHAQRWLLRGASALVPRDDGMLVETLRRHAARLEVLAAGDLASLLTLDTEPLERETKALLRAVGEALDHASATGSRRPVCGMTRSERGRP